MTRDAMLLVRALRDPAATAMLDGDGWTVACLCAAWCGTCGIYRPLFNELARAHPDVRFEWVDIEDESDLAGDLVSDLGTTLNTVFNQDLLDSETSSSTANIGGDANQLVDNLTTNADTLLDGLLGTGTLLSDLVDDTSTALLEDTLGEVLSGDGTGDVSLTDGLAATVDQGTDAVDTLAAEVGLDGVTEPLTEGVVDASATDLLAAADEALIGTSTEPGGRACSVTASVRA